MREIKREIHFGKQTALEIDWIDAEPLSVLATTDTIFISFSILQERKKQLLAFRELRAKN